MGLGKFLKKKGAILEYGDYYSSYRTELISILDYYLVKGYRAAIWGAGLKGTAFLNRLDKKGLYISSVIDMNRQLHGTNITKYHKVCSLEEEIKRNPNVVFIMNSDHFADNFASLREKGYEGSIIDLDYIIENKIKPKELIDGTYEDKIYIEYDLSEIHRVLLDILKEIDRICKKHKIQYFLSAGTALGAIRHKGFIPWDDDADIGMLREDFERFRLVIKEETGKNYYYQQMEPGCDFYRPFDQIGKRNTSFVVFHAKDLKMRHGIHVDVFPFDNVPEDKEDREKQVKEVQHYRNKIYQKLVPHVVDSRNILKKIIINHQHHLMKVVPYKYLNKKIANSLKLYQNTETGYIADLLTHYKKIMFFKKDDILPVTYTDFEGIQLPVPKNADIYLKEMYGDYLKLPPEGKRNQRHRLVKLSCSEEYYKDKLWFGE